MANGLPVRGVRINLVQYCIRVVAVLGSKRVETSRKSFSDRTLRQNNIRVLCWWL